MRQFYAHAGINWTWYAQVTIEDDQATIHLHDRLHHERHAGKHPETAGQFRLVEDDSRQVHTIELYTRTPGEGPVVWGTYQVTNPQHVFSYGNFEDK